MVDLKQYNQARRDEVGVFSIINDHASGNILRHIYKFADMNLCTTRGKCS